MSSNLDHFSRGIAKAVERRLKARQQAAKIVENIDSDAVTSITTSDAVSTNINTAELSEEQYKSTLVQKMIALIHKRNLK